MSTRLNRAADLPSSSAVASVRRVADRMRRLLASWRAARHRGAALREVGPAFASFEPRDGDRGAALRRIAGLAAELRAYAHRDARLFDALLRAARSAEARFRPPGLRAYAERSVRTAAVGAFAEYVVGQRPSHGGVESLFAALAAHAPDERAVPLAHAEWLIDHGRAEEARPLVQRSLRINAVCQTAQRLLARLEPDDYDLSGKFCPMPFTHLSTSYKADAFTCCCSAWQPYAVGNAIEAPSAESLWNSEAAQEIRRSIHDGDFSYCSRTLCSYIAARSLPDKAEVEDPLLRAYIAQRTVIVEERPRMAQLNHDPSCNLACPSCRGSVVTAGPAEQATYVDAAERVLLPLLQDMEGFVYISGGGEAFASTHYRKILGKLNRREFPGLSIYLISNGQLLNEKRWAEYPNLPEMIGVLSISIDAARAQTYERLRRPGKWDRLMENLETAAALRRQGGIRRLQINFVVQAENFREIPAFIDLGARLGVDQIWLQRLTNYGSYAESAFAEADVSAPQHPDHPELLGILRAYLDHPLVDMDMLLPLLPEVVGSRARNPYLRRAGGDDWVQFRI